MTYIFALQDAAGLFLPNSVYANVFIIKTAKLSKFIDMSVRASKFWMVTFSNNSISQYSNLTYTKFSTGIWAVTATVAAIATTVQVIVVIVFDLLFNFSLFLSSFLPEDWDLDPGTEPLKGEVAILGGNLGQAGNNSWG